METQINSIPICSKTQHRKDSLHLTLKKYKFFKLISTLEFIFIIVFNFWQHFGMARREQVNTALFRSVTGSGHYIFTSTELKLTMLVAIALFLQL
jgi:hypothetical protein